MQFILARRIIPFAFVADRCTSEAPPSATPAACPNRLCLFPPIPHQPNPLDLLTTITPPSNRLPSFHEIGRQRIAEPRISVRCCRITRCAWPLRGRRRLRCRATSRPNLPRPRRVRPIDSKLATSNSDLTVLLSTVELETGQLVKDESFTLFEAVGALEVRHRHKVIETCGRNCTLMMD